MNIPKVRISEIYDSIQGEGFLVGSYTRFDFKVAMLDVVGVILNTLGLLKKAKK